MFDFYKAKKSNWLALLSSWIFLSDDFVKILQKHEIYGKICKYCYIIEG